MSYEVLYNDEIVPSTSMKVGDDELKLNGKQSLINADWSYLSVFCSPQNLFTILNSPKNFFHMLHRVLAD